MKFKWGNWGILFVGELFEVGSLMWALWEQRGCPLAWLLLVGFGLQIVSVFLLIFPVPRCCEFGKYSSEKLIRLIHILLLCDAVTFAAIAIPAFGCGNLEDAMGALFSLTGAIFSAVCDYNLGPDLWDGSDKPVSSPPPEAGIVVRANTSEDNKYRKLVDDLLLETGLEKRGMEGEFKYPLAWNNWDSEILSTRLKNAFLKNLTSHDPDHKADHEKWLDQRWKYYLLGNEIISWDESIGIGNLIIKFKAWKNVREKTSASKDNSWENEDFISFKWKFTRKPQKV